MKKLEKIIKLLKEIKKENINDEPLIDEVGFILYSVETLQKRYK